MANLQSQRINVQMDLSHTENMKQTRMLKALVITPNEKTIDVGSLLAIARSEACRREHTQENPIVRAMVFVPELGVYVAVYESMVQNSHA